jgi:hypothetical protein
VIRVSDSTNVQERNTVAKFRLNFCLTLHLASTISAAVLLCSYETVTEMHQAG